MKNSSVKASMIWCAVVTACVFSCSDEDEHRVQVTSALSQAKITNGVNSSVGEPIDLATARKWAAAYKSSVKEGEVLSHFFGSEIIEQLLQQTGCMGIRIYYGLNERGEKQLMLVGVDAEGNDMLPPSTGSRISEEGNIIADASFPCPNYCPGSGL